LFLPQQSIGVDHHYVLESVDLDTTQYDQ